MSRENIQFFFEKSQTSLDLMGKIQAAWTNDDLQAGAKTLAKLSGEAGFPFTAVEFLESVQSKGEMTDEQLAPIAGGWFGFQNFGVWDKLLNPSDYKSELVKEVGDYQEFKTTHMPSGETKINKTQDGHRVRS